MPEKKILIIGDSVAMPRKEVLYEETWISLLINKFPEIDFINKTGRGTTSLRLVTEGGGGLDLLELYNPDLVIFQFGITEAAPRLFKKKGFEFFLLSRIMPPKIQQKYIRLIKKRRVRNPKVTDTSPSDFRKNIENYCLRADKINTQIAIIPIIKATADFIKKSPFIQRNIDLYNSIYVDIAKKYKNTDIIIPFEENIDIEKISVDELHIDKDGSKIIYIKLADYINKKI